MLENIAVKNFKCFKELYLEMSNLNVFAGINNMGKSTIIQALLLLRQSYEMSSISKGLHLNGNITSIGTGYDLLHRNSEEDGFEISVQCNEEIYKWRYKYNRDSDFQELIVSNVTSEKCNNVNIFYPTFAYVSAERIGPQRIYKKSYHEVVEKNQVGYRGELFADYVAERGLTDKVENKAVIHESTKNEFLIYQTQAWLSEISPGIHINTRGYTEAGLVSVEYGISDNGFNPINVGFGLSYVAPIIVSLLKAKRGDLIILENPEAHLHPRGQRMMGELIARACSGGVQVIVETHSDHLLNGIRLAVKKNLINRTQIRLNYFYQEMEIKELTYTKIKDLGDSKTEELIHTKTQELVHKKCSPMILDDGSLSDWPDGFFDEWEKAIDELF
ncbi:DUF3696 domain-containing protein [Tissierella carlieri]|uniref:DUF3696 domain-containing protein n=1 Tax=Tissierella carlieri TaxID=689904 RepID=UPI00386AC8FE